MRQQKKYCTHAGSRNAACFNKKKTLIGHMKIHKLSFALEKDAPV